MQDLTADYAAAIEAVHNAATTYRLAVDTLADAEEELEYETAKAQTLNEDCRAYVNALDGAKDPTAPIKAQRLIVWLYDHAGAMQEAARKAKQAKLAAEYAYDYARRLCELNRLRVLLYLGSADPRPATLTMPSGKAYPRGDGGTFTVEDAETVDAR